MNKILIMICGISGVGKTTLARIALEKFSCLKYLQTFTTRLPRPGELSTFEHRFVSPNEYMRLRAQSLNWSHLEIYGNYYGIDLSVLFHSGYFITIVSPMVKYISDLKTRFNGDSYQIFVDVPYEIVRERLVRDRGPAGQFRADQDAQLDLSGSMEISDYIFRPANNLQLDGEEFLTLLSEKLDT